MEIELEDQLSQGFDDDIGVKAPGMDCGPVSNGATSFLGLVGVRRGAGEASRSSSIGRC